jgi:hypothetical protein
MEREEQQGHEDEEMSRTVTAGDLALSGGGLSLGSVATSTPKLGRETPKSKSKTKKINPLIRLQDDEATVRAYAFILVYRGNLMSIV